MALGLVFITHATAQDDSTHHLQADSLIQQNKTTSNRGQSFKITTFIVPSALIIYGVVALNNDALQNFDRKLQEEIWTENPHKSLHLDTYLQFLPAVAVYGLNIAGVKGKNNLRDRSMIYLLSNVIGNLSVYAIKKTSHRLRPDSSDYYSFPSGHSAEAFLSAEFLMQEYKDVSIWYGIGGYAAAVATGYLRMYNNKHWFSDVVAGAGIGLASTRLVYWLYPKTIGKLFKDKKSTSIILPTYQSGAIGMIYVHSF